MAVSLRRAEMALLIALLIGAFGLRLWDLNEPSVWHDEGWSIRAIRDPIGTPDDKTPLAYYSLIHLLWQGAGETPLALRYGSVLLDLITMALAARIMRQWAGWGAALLTALLLGLSPLLWAYAREIRAYVGVPLLTAVLLAQADVLLAPRARVPRRVWAATLIAELVLLYTHNLSVPVIGWLNLVVGGVWLWRRAWKTLGLWIAGQAAVLVAYLPWMLGQAPSGTPLNAPPVPGLALVWDIWQGYFAPLPTLVGAKTALMVGSGLFGVAALLSAATALMNRLNRRTLLLLSQALLIPALTTIELRVANIDFHPRYYIASAPATMMLVALGTVSVPHEVEFHGIAVPATIALACGVGAASFMALFDDAYQHDDFRAVSAYYATLPDDAIIVIPYGWEPAIEEYYQEKAGIRAEILGIDLHRGAAMAMNQINAALAQRRGPTHVELLTWFQLPADMRGMYPCLLESAGRRADRPEFTVQGITTTGYSVERPLALAKGSSTTVEYGQLNLVGANVSGQQAVCAKTEWVLQRASGEDWRVSGRLLTTNPPGWTIAHSDSDIRADDQTPTSMWDAGGRGEGFSLLRFPDGTPPGDYEIQLIVFSRSKAHGLDRLIDGAPSGTALALTTVRPAGTTGQDIRLPEFDPVKVASDPAVELIGHDAKAKAPLSAGQELRITLRWHVAGDCCQDAPWTDATVILAGEGWEIAQPVAAYTAYSLDWHAIRIPAEANGAATLAIAPGEGEPILLATYTIEKTDRLFAPPAFDAPMGTAFTGLATLEGFSVGQTTISTDETLELTLVWRVTRTPPTSYRVFTHLLDADGRVIAQHDGFPANDSRFTTSWAKDEYIVDLHALAFDPERKDYRGPARIEVGFYNPDTNERVRAANGADHVLLPVEITVE